MKIQLQKTVDQVHIIGGDASWVQELVLPPDPAPPEPAAPSAPSTSAPSAIADADAEGIEPDGAEAEGADAEEISEENVEGDWAHFAQTVIEEMEDMKMQHATEKAQNELELESVRAEIQTLQGMFKVRSWARRVGRVGGNWCCR